MPQVKIALLIGLIVLNMRRLGMGFSCNPIERKKCIEFGPKGEKEILNWEATNVLKCKKKNPKFLPNFLTHTNK